MVGGFQGNIDFGNGNLISQGGYDAYVAKLDTNGNFLWAKRYGDATGQVAYAVTVDQGDDVIVAGRFQGKINFGGGALETQGVAMFVAKLDGANGNEVWAVAYDGPTPNDEVIPWDLEVDSKKDILMGGHILYDVGTHKDAIVAKLDESNGAVLWTQGWTQDGANQDIYGIAVTATDGVLATGYFYGTVDFGKGQVVNSAGADLMLLRLDAQGAPTGASTYGDGSSEIVGLGIDTDSGGNLAVVGSFQGSLDFGGGALNSANNAMFDVFVAKLDNNFAELWRVGFGDNVAGQYGRSVVVDGADDVVICGDFESTIKFGNTTHTSKGDLDHYIAKLKGVDGGALWSHRFGDSSLQQFASVTVDGNNNIFWAGDFTGEVDFPITLKSMGLTDVFIAKLQP